MIKTYTVKDERGRTIEIEEQHILPHLRKPFTAILVEMGYDAQQIAAYNGDIAYLTNLILVHIRDQHCRLKTAREEFRKLKVQREADFETILEYLRQQTSAPIDKKVIPINREREEKAA